MKTRIAAAVAALVIGVAAPVSPAMAFPYAGQAGHYESRAAYGSNGYWGHHDHPRYTGCPMSSASEGNANQQTRPVKQYGQTAGGYRC